MEKVKLTDSNDFSFKIISIETHWNMDTTICNVQLNINNKNKFLLTTVNLIFVNEQQQQKHFFFVQEKLE